MNFCGMKQRYNHTQLAEVKEHDEVSASLSSGHGLLVYFATLLPCSTIKRLSLTSSQITKSSIGFGVKNHGPE